MTTVIPLLKAQNSHGGVTEGFWCFPDVIPSSSSPQAGARMGTNIPIVLPVRNWALGSCPEAVSTGVLGPSWALWAALHRKFLGVQ